ncbi:lipoprotein [Pseudomonas aeruginosa]|nr:lipoprotein [Pseudomonas aeruginosa]
MRFRIDNPNDFSLPVRGLQYTVQLNDIQLAEGESGQWFTVPPTATRYSTCRCEPISGAT